IFWAVVNFALYTYASEKMPWLLVNTSVPLIILSGKFLGELSSNINWDMMKSWQGFPLLVAIPISLITIWNLLVLDFSLKELDELLRAVIIVVALMGLIFFATKSMQFFGITDSLKILALSLALILALLSFRAAITASFEYEDVPVELLVYTQTSPDVLSILDEIEKTDRERNISDQIWVTIDQTSGFTWPWAWYLRHRAKVEFPNYDAQPMKSVPNSSVVITHLNNKASTDKTLGDSFTKGKRFKHRWWFPEYRYRDITLTNFLPTIVNRSTWINIVEYYLHRSGVDHDLGSEDAVVYFAR
ncbi:MAG: hypothetical protein VX701_04790, partial [Chloroflexota bacterium]|nr:hypothetical protein [Chloroflexota bacterium]